MRRRSHFHHQDRIGSGYADISWHGTQRWHADLSGESRCLAFLIDGRNACPESVEDNFIYVAANAYWEPLWYELPHLPEGKQWYIFANTGVRSPDDIYEPGKEPRLDNQEGLLVGDRAAVALVGR